MSKKNIISELSKYDWGFGIEHEMHIFHNPRGSIKNISDFILFDSKSAVDRIFADRESNKISLSDEDYHFLKAIPFELSGRKCNNEWVIERVPIEMPEFITNLPFCSLKKNRGILAMTNEIIKAKELFYKLLLKDKITKLLINNYGNMTEYPYGMTRYLKYPIKEIKGKYFFPKNKTKTTDLIRPEYNGSYHITMTLPYTQKTTQSEFIKMHQNFANQLQWLEPLLLTAFFSGDEYAPGSIKKRVRGSFRVMIIGWGNFAGSDIRLFNKGIGRYAKTPTYWRKGLKFEDIDKLKPCYKASKMALNENAITSLSSDFRTFGLTKEGERASGVGMTKPNGIEFRIFDQFSDKYIDSLIRLISLVAENSRVTKTIGYVYENKIWIKALHDIMTHGYKAIISKEYINILRKKLGLKINSKSLVAYDIFLEIYKELWEKNVNGKWYLLFNNLEIKPFNSIIIPQINKKAWQFAFMIKLNRHPDLIKKFNILSSFINKYNKSLSLSFTNFKMGVLSIFGNHWINDIEDIAYFYDTLNYVSLEKNIYGSITKLTLDKDFKIPKIKNFNKILIEYMDAKEYLRNIF